MNQGHELLDLKPKKTQFYGFFKFNSSFIKISINQHDAEND